MTRVTQLIYSILYRCNRMKSFYRGLLVVVSCYLTIVRGSNPRPWCLDGSAVCRGNVAPTERFGQTMTLIPVNQTDTKKLQAVIMGGQRSQYASSILPLSTIELLTLEDMTLQSITANFSSSASVTMRPRSGHVAVAYHKNKVLVFGGVTYNRTKGPLGVSTTNDLLLLEWGVTGARDPSWRPITNSTDGRDERDPLPRQRAAAALVGDALWIFGGLSNTSTLLNDTYMFNLTTNQWRRMNVNGGVIPGDGNTITGLMRASMAASPNGKYLLMYGGRTQTGPLITDVPQNNLWLLDVSNIGPNNTVSWYRVDMQLYSETDPSGRNPKNPAGFDSAISFVPTINGWELAITAVGAWKATETARSSSWKQWINVLRSDTDGQIESQLETLVTGSMNSITFKQQAFFSVPASVVKLLDNTILNLSLTPRKPYPSNLQWVKDCALALTPDGKELFLAGGSGTSQASTKLLRLDLGSGSLTDLDSSLRPDYVQSKTNSYIFRHAVHITPPLNSTTWNSSNPSTRKDVLVYTGLDNTKDASDPRFHEFRVLDLESNMLSGKCSSANYASPNTCKVLPLPRNGTSVNDLPSARDGAALAPIYQVFRLENVTTGESADVGAVLLLMYGGMSMVGDTVNTTSVNEQGDDGLDAGEQRVMSALTSCEASCGASDSLARCVYSNLKAAPDGVCQSLTDAYLPAEDYTLPTYEDYGDYVSYGDYSLMTPSDFRLPPESPMAPDPPTPTGQPPAPDGPSPPEARRRQALAKPYNNDHLPDNGEEAVSASRRGLALQRRRQRETQRSILAGGVFTDGAGQRSVWGNRAQVSAAGQAGAEQSNSWSAGSRLTSIKASGSSASESSQARLPEQYPAGYEETLAPTVFGTAYAILWQGEARPSRPLWDREEGFVHAEAGLKGATQTAAAGPAFVFDVLINANGSPMHSPGLRASAAMVRLPAQGATNADVILFGGLTAVNQTLDNPTGMPLVTNDVHYLQYIPATPSDGSEASLPLARFPPCPFSNISGCRSVGAVAHSTAPPPPSFTPPAPDRLAPIADIPLYKDCPVKNDSGVGLQSKMGTFQLRVWRSAELDVAKGMGISFSSMDSKFYLEFKNISRDVAQGPCCPANDTSNWAWPPINRSVTTNQNNMTVFTFELPYELLWVELTSNGNGWTSKKDKAAPLRCNVTESPWRCPRIDLFSVDANRTVVGMGGGNAFTVWEEPATKTNSYVRSIRLALCPDRVAPPQAPDDEAESLAPPPPEPEQIFPFHIPDRPNMLRSHELLVASESNELPPPRHRHAAAFVDTASLSPDLGYGTLGILFVHGGTTDPLSGDPAQLLGDLWLFDLQFRTWRLIDPDGDDPGPRMRHSLTVDGSLVYLSGGYVWDSEALLWVNTNDVYYIDMVLGFEAVWTKVEGNAEKLARTSVPTGLTEGIGISRQRNQLVAPNNKGLVFVPLPKTTSVANYLSTSTNQVSTNGTTRLVNASAIVAKADMASVGGSVMAKDAAATSIPSLPAPMVSGTVIQTVTAEMYDGDLLLLPEDRDILVAENMTITASVVVHGKVGSRSSPTPSPVAGPSNGLRRTAMQTQGSVPRGDTKSEGAESTESTASDINGSFHHLTVLDSQRSRDRLLLGEQLQAQLQDPLVLRAVDSATRVASAAATRAATAAFRRALQAATISTTSRGEPDVDLTQLLAMKRSRVECLPNATWNIDAAPSMVNMDFVNCQFNILDANNLPTVFINCVFRNTVGRPVIVVQPHAKIALQSCVFLNNSNSNIASYGGNGSAIYVYPYGGITEIADSAFKWNGLNTTAGGAIYLAGSGACLSEITNTVFNLNGPFSSSSTVLSSDTSKSFVAGGAIAFEGAGGCNVIIEGTAFAHNSAGQGKGGALYFSRTDEVHVTITNSNFTLNSAKYGGGAYMANVLGKVTLTNVNFSSNVGFSRGGGLAMDGVRSCTGTKVILASNRALAGAGGGIMHARQGELVLTNCTIINNTALYGGGVGGSQDLDLQLVDSLVVNNTAQHGGGVECFMCYRFGITRTTFRDNRASSAGAVSLMTTELGGVIADSDFINNIGMPEASWTKISDVGCSRDSTGGGGAVCINLRKFVTLRGGSFANNTAVSGGALFLQQRCFPGDDECGPLVISSGTIMRNNAAVRGGGGVVFRAYHNLTNVTCANASMPLPWEDLHRGCSEWINNTAVYGNNTATIAYKLQLLTPPNGYLPSYRSNDLVDLSVAVVDFHGQRIIDATSEAMTSMNVNWQGQNASSAGQLNTSSTNTYNNKTVLLSGLTTTAVRGVANFSTKLKLQAMPGNYNMTADAPLTFQALSPLPVLITVRPCIRGEITSKAGDQCFPCDPGTFSLNPSNLVCDTCPEHANCTVMGMPWVVLPDDGYWRSGPYSPNILECTVKDACTGSRKWNRQVAIVSYLQSLNVGNVTYNLTAYLSLQCAHGYRGALCGRCIPGYGKRASGVCSKCATRGLNSLFFVLSTGVNVLLIWFTVWLLLPNDDPECTEDEKQQAPEVAPAGPVMLDSCTPYGADEQLGLGANTTQNPPAPDLLALESGTAPLQSSHLSNPPVGPRQVPAGSTQSPVRGPPFLAVTGSVQPASALPSSTAAPVMEASAVPVEEESRPSSGRSSHSTQDRDVAKEADWQEGGWEEEEGPYKGGNYGIVLKILVSYLQVTGMVRELTTQWPSFIAGILAAAKSVSQTVTTIVSIDCSLTDTALPISVQRILITISTPFVILVLFLIAWCIRFGVLRISGLARRQTTFKHYLRPRLIITTIAIIFYVYPDVTKALMSLFSCRTVDPTSGSYSDLMEARGMFWTNDLDLKCYKSTHLWLAFALGLPGGTLFAIGLPIFSWYWLRVHLYQLYASEDFYNSYHFMYEDYKPPCYFWDSMIMFRKLAVITVIVFLKNYDSALQVLTALGVIIFALLAQLIIAPYKNARMNYLERLSLFTTLAMLYGALFFVSSIPKLAKTIIGAFLMLLNVCVIVYFVYNIAYELVLGVIWAIDDHSNADGVLTWEDIWIYVHKVHGDAKYTPALVRCLTACQTCTTCCHAAFRVPLQGARAVTASFKRLRQHRHGTRIVATSDAQQWPQQQPVKPSPVAISSSGCDNNTVTQESMALHASIVVAPMTQQMTKSTSLQGTIRQDMPDTVDQPQQQQQLFAEQQKPPRTPPRPSSPGSQGPWVPGSLRASKQFQATNQAEQPPLSLRGSSLRANNLGNSMTGLPAATVASRQSSRNSMMVAPVGRLSRPPTASKAAWQGADDNSGEGTVSFAQDNSGVEVCEVDRLAARQRAAYEGESARE